MKLATLKQGGRDGNLIVVNKSLTHAVKVPDIAKSLMIALESWEYCEYNLQQVYRDLNRKKIKNSFNLDIDKLAPPLPRSFQRLIANTYLVQLERIYSSRKLDFPEAIRQSPHIYQAASDNFLPCRESIPLSYESWGCDMQPQLAIITDDVPSAADTNEAQHHIRLLLLANNISLHHLSERAGDQSPCQPDLNPCTSFSPIAVTPDELSEHWHDNKLQLKLTIRLNEITLGQLATGNDMQFDFSQLLSHAAKIRKLSAGSIICTGPMANSDTGNGASNLQDQRNIEILQHGQASTEYLHFGDRIQIEAFDQHGQTIFGSIDQSVIQW